jgi:electron transfer flavoprotein beta subunit
MLRICVCIKQVPDVSAPISVRDGKLSQDIERLVLDAYSASAVEESLVITEAHGGQVDVVLIGPEKAKETIRKALAMGAEQGYHIQMEDELLEDESWDSARYAAALAEFFKDKSYDIIAVGKQSQDTDSGLTGSMLAELLDLPYTTNAVAMQWNADQGKLEVHRQGDTGQEVLAMAGPCLVTCSNDMNDPRIPSLKGIMASKKKVIETLSAPALTGKAATTTVIGYENVPARKAGRKFEGDPEELAKQLFELLRNEAKVL